MSVRTALAADLQTALGETWRIVAVDRNVDTPTMRTLIVSQRTVAAAPSPHQVDVKLNLDVMTAHQDIARAEDDLDDAIVELVEALTTGFPTLQWSTASKGIYADKWPAYTFEVTVRATVTPPEPDPEPDPEPEE